MDVPRFVHVRDVQEASARVWIALNRTALVYGLQENEGDAEALCVATGARVDPPRERLPVDAHAVAEPKFVVLVPR
eukprot:8098826-Pyramimonas_sp.AAC.1